MRRRAGVVSRPHRGRHAHGRAVCRRHCRLQPGHYAGQCAVRTVAGAPGAWPAADPGQPACRGGRCALRDCGFFAVHRRNFAGRARPVPAHRGTGRQSAGNRRCDGRAVQHRAAHCRHFERGGQRQHAQCRSGAGGRAGRAAGGASHARHRAVVAQGGRDCLGDRGHCLSDQPAGPQCRRGSGTRRRAGQGFCRGGWRGAGAGAAQCGGGQGNPCADRHLGPRWPMARARWPRRARRLPVWCRRCPA